MSILNQTFFAVLYVVIGALRLAVEYLLPRLIQLIAVLVAEKLIP